MNIYLDSSSTESDVFYVEQSSVEGSLIRNNTPAILNSTEISGAMEREVTTFSSVASPEPRIVTLDSDSNDPTIPYRFGSQQPIWPPGLNDLNLPPNPFNVVATMAVVQADDAYSPQSPEPSIPLPISTPPMNVTTIEGWRDTTHTTNDDATFYTDDEPRRVCLLGYFVERHFRLQRAKKCVCRLEPFLHSAASPKTKKGDSA